MVFKFDLTDLPINSKILSAKFEIYSLAYNEMDTIQDDPSNPKWDAGPIGIIKAPGNNFKYLYPINAKWSETEATWDIANSYDVYDFNMYTTVYAGNPKIYPNAPDSFPENSIAFGGSRERELWEVYDLTSYIQDIACGKSENYGFLMSTQRTDSVITYMFSAKYASSEYGDQTLRPKLTIVYDGKVTNSDYSNKIKSKIPLQDEMQIINSRQVLLKFKNTYKKSGTIKVLRLNGAEVSTHAFRTFADEYYYELPSLAKGAYVIRCSVKESEFSKKFFLH